MADDLTILAIAAASIGVMHTLLGPDHYLPFVVLARARGWSLARTSAITLLCGAGHVAGSVVLGLAGLALGLAVSSLEAVEAWRGDLAAWLLVAVGVLYGAWGLHRALRGKGHAHLHGGLAAGLGDHHHEGGRRPSEQRAGRHRDVADRSPSGGVGDQATVGVGEGHCHRAPLPADLRDEIHLRAHAEEVAGRPAATPWVLFVVFVLGPCEPLIPLLMYPAATHRVGGLVLVTALFAAATLATMLAVVVLATLGASLLPMGRLERYGHALAGAAIALSGLGIELLGL
jgi:hypothetical protein